MHKRGKLIAISRQAKTSIISVKSHDKAGKTEKLTKRNENIHEHFCAEVFENAHLKQGDTNILGQKDSCEVATNAKTSSDEAVLRPGSDGGGCSAIAARLPRDRDQGTGTETSEQYASRAGQTQVDISSTCFVNNAECVCVPSKQERQSMATDESSVQQVFTSDTRTTSISETRNRSDNDAKKRPGTPEDSKFQSDISMKTDEKTGLSDKLLENKTENGVGKGIKSDVIAEGSDSSDSDIDVGVETVADVIAVSYHYSITQETEKRYTEAGSRKVHATTYTPEVGTLASPCDTASSPTSPVAMTSVSTGLIAGQHFSISFSNTHCEPASQNASLSAVKRVKSTLDSADLTHNSVAVETNSSEINDYKVENENTVALDLSLSLKDKTESNMDDSKQRSAAKHKDKSNSIGLHSDDNENRKASVVSPPQLGPIDRNTPSEHTSKRKAESATEKSNSSAVPENILSLRVPENVLSVRVPRTVDSTHMAAPFASSSPCYLSFDPRLLQFYSDEDKKKLVESGFIPPVYSPTSLPRESVLFPEALHNVGNHLDQDNRPFFADTFLQDMSNQNIHESRLLSSFSKKTKDEPCSSKESPTSDKTARKSWAGDETTAFSRQWVPMDTAKSLSRPEHSRKPKLSDRESGGRNRATPPTQPSAAAIPVGIAIARKRPDTSDKKEAESQRRVTTSTQVTSAQTQSPDIGATARESSRTTSSHGGAASGLTSNLMLTGGNTSVLNPPSSERWASQRTAASAASRPQNVTQAGGYWLGNGIYSLPPPSRQGAQLQYNPPPGYKITQDPVTRQLFVIPDVSGGYYGSLSPHQASPVARSPSERPESRRTPTTPGLLSPPPDPRRTPTNQLLSPTTAKTPQKTDSLPKSGLVSPEGNIKTSLPDGGSSRRDLLSPALSSGRKTPTNASSTSVTSPALMPPHPYIPSVPITPAAHPFPYPYPYSPYYWPPSAYPPQSTRASAKWPPPSAQAVNRGTSPVDFTVRTSVTSSAISKETREASAQTTKAGVIEACVQTIESPTGSARKADKVDTPVSGNKAVTDNSSQTDQSLNELTSDNATKCLLCHCSSQTDKSKSGVKEENLTIKTMSNATNSSSQSDDLHCDLIQSGTKADFEGDSMDGLHILSTLALHSTAPIPGTTHSRNIKDLTRPLSIDTNMDYPLPPLYGMAPLSPDLSSDYNVPKSIYFSDDFMRRRPSKASSLSEDDVSSVFKIGTGPENMDPKEVEVRSKLAELQRQYKEKQKQLAKLKPKSKEGDGKKCAAKIRKRRDSSKSQTKDEKSVHAPSIPTSSNKQVKVENTDAKPVSCPRTKAQLKYMQPSSGTTASTSETSHKPRHSISDEPSRKQTTRHSISDEPSRKQTTRNSLPDEPNRQRTTRHSITDEPSRKQTTQQNLSDEPSRKQTTRHSLSDDSDMGELSSMLEDTFLEGNGSKTRRSAKKKLPFSAGFQDFSPGMSGKRLNTSTSSLGILAQYASSQIEVNQDGSAKLKKKRKPSTKSDESNYIPSKKRKPGRPKKYSKDQAVTQTLVSKSSKNFSFFNIGKAVKRMKALKEGNKGSLLQAIGEWSRRRSERIFLSDAVSPAKSTSSSTSSCPVSESPSSSSARIKASTLSLPQMAQEGAGSVGGKARVPTLAERVLKPGIMASAHKPAQSMTPFKADSSQQKPSVTEARERYSIRSNSSEFDSDSDDNSSDSDEVLPEVGKDETAAVWEQTDDTRSTSPAPDVRSSVLTQADLSDGLKILYFMEGLFYEARVKEIQPPDVYGVMVKGERGNRPHILSREELLNDAVMDIQPPSLGNVPVGRRVCAYWSQQFSCLYPGMIVKATPVTKGGGSKSHKLVNVEFDDGDDGRIPLEHVRLLPQDFPVQTYDDDPPSPAAGKRKKRSISEDLLADSWRERKPSMSDALTRYQVMERLKAEAKRKMERFNEEQRRRGLAGAGDGPSGRSDSGKSGADSAAAARHSSLSPARRAAGSRQNTFHRSLSVGAKSKSKSNMASPAKKSKKEESKWPSDCESDCSSRSAERSDALSDADVAGTSGNKKPANQLKSRKKSVSKATAPRRKSESAKAKSPSGSSAKKRRTASATAASILPAHQIWTWMGPGTKRPKKTFYKAIKRGKEILRLGDCAVFLTVGRPNLPYIGRIESLFETRGGNLTVRVKWFYHPEETKGGRRLAQIKGALYESPHGDENDVQTISHKCDVMSYTRYKAYKAQQTTGEADNVYYLAGFYDPTSNLLKFEGDVKVQGKNW